MTLKEIIKLITPPVLIHLAKRLLVKGLSGDYRNWDEAMAASTGYDSEIILEKTRTALLKVKNGEAVYERDSVLVDEVQYAWPLLASLMWVAAQHQGKLNVLDFGGSLGSTYFQNRAFLCSLPDMRWNIVEQPKHVDVGKKWFEDERLRFYFSIEDCLVENQPNVVVLSSVLHYLEHPCDLLNKLSELTCNYLIIDRTPFWCGVKDMLCVQKVPPSIYPASYPSWIFSEQQFRAKMSKQWDITTVFDSLDKLEAPVKAFWKGMLLTRKQHTIGNIVL